jgi:hypothetical protein
MRLTMHFPSNTNEREFLYWVEDNYPQYLTACYQRNGEIIISAVPEYERTRMIEEAKVLGAFITEGDDRMATVL